ncbi:unnamed protein product, partial [Rotaria magnacalcarata]
YNRRFVTRLSRNHPNIWSFMQLIQCEHVHFEHISIQLDAGASIPKQSKKTKVFQMKFNNLQERFLKKEMNCNQLLIGLSELATTAEKKNAEKENARNVNTIHVQENGE